MAEAVLARIEPSSGRSKGMRRKVRRMEAGGFLAEDRRIVQMFAVDHDRWIGRERCASDPDIQEMRSRC